MNRRGDDLGFTQLAGKRAIDTFFHEVLKRRLVIGRWFIWWRTQNIKISRIHTRAGVRCSCGWFTMSLVMGITGHHLFGDDIHSKSERRGHEEAARLSNDANPAGRREVKVHHGHDCVIDLQKTLNITGPVQIPRKESLFYYSLNYTAAVLNVCSNNTSGNMLGLNPWCISINFEDYGADQFQLSLTAIKTTTDVQDFHVESNFLLKTIKMCIRIPTHKKKIKVLITEMRLSLTPISKTQRASDMA